MAGIGTAPTLDKTTQRIGRTQDMTLAWQFVREYVQDGMGTICIDDWAVSFDARIGCNGSSDVASPAAPKNLMLK